MFGERKGFKLRDQDLCPGTVLPDAIDDQLRLYRVEDTS
jgi:hypothetical protein